MGRVALSKYMSSRGSSKLGLPPSGVSTSTKNAGGVPDPEVDKLQNDLLLLTQRIADITGEPQRAPPALGSMKDSAGFVNGLRGMTESSTDDHKMGMLNKVLGKISELDRIVLKKTAPEKDVSARRGSRGMDLTSLPTHLHITDRLLDLHTKSQRVTVIKTGGGGSGTGAPESTCAPGSPRGAKINGSDAKTIEKLQQKLEDSEAKRRAVAEDCSLARREIASLKKELDEVTQSTRDRDAAAQQVISEEVERLKAALAAARGEVEACQESLEAETGRSLAAVKEVIARGMDISSGGGGSGGGGEGSSRGLSEEMRRALTLLDEGLAGRESGRREELVSINSVKEALEAENQSLTLNMDLLNKDLLSVQSELEAMRTSYHQLHSETIGKEGAGARAEKDLKAANDKIVELQTELVNAARRTLELERIPLQLEQEQARSRTFEEGNIKLQTALTSKEEECKQYRSLNDTLKNKLRDMSGKDASAREFLDSFEEVLQDEMMAMKSAFELKLKHKSDEVDAMSTRHRQEIQRLSANASPYTRL